MAGSLEDYVYTDDVGATWTIRRDASLTTVINVSPAPTNAGAGSDTLPQGIEPRYVNYNSADGRVRRKAVLLSPTAAALLAVPDLINVVVEGQGGVDLFLTSYIGERRRIVPGVDTGLEEPVT